MQDFPPDLNKSKFNPDHQKGPDSTEAPKEDGGEQKPEKDHTK